MPDESVGATPARGLQIRVDEPELQGYLQRYPFASGPDAEMNRRGIEALAANVAWREAGRSAGEAVEVELLAPEEARLGAADEGAVRRMMNALRLSAEEQAKHLDDFGWKVKELPRGTKSVLVIGCGDGIELLFLRAVLPEARFTAIDYYDSLLPGLAEMVGLDHRIGDMNTILKSLAMEYDLVFSNHTMEHLYAPDDVLRVLAGLLVEGGVLTSALPMCGCPGMPFLERTAALADGERELHPLDVVFVDAGHPWKTNPGDLAATLTRARFGEVRILQRREHLCRPLAADRAGMERARARDLALHRRWLEPMRRMMKLVFPRRTPDSMTRWFFALERRLPFSTNRVMNLYSEEALISCRRG